MDKGLSPESQIMLGVRDRIKVLWLGTRTVPCLTASEGTVTFGAQSGSVVVAKIGYNSVKINIYKIVLTS